MLGLTGTGQSTVMGIQVLDTGVFGGIILGCITGAVFKIGRASCRERV